MIDEVLAYLRAPQDTLPGDSWARGYWGSGTQRYEIGPILEEGLLITKADTAGMVLPHQRPLHTLLGKMNKGKLSHLMQACTFKSDNEETSLYLIRYKVPLHKGVRVFEEITLLHQPEGREGFEYGVYCGDDFFETSTRILHPLVKVHIPLLTRASLALEELDQHQLAFHLAEQATTLLNPPTSNQHL